MCANQPFVWYASYGSNLLYEGGFSAYIKGGFRNGCSRKEIGCKDKNPPIKNKTFDLSFPLYFAERASKWNHGGVSFISLTRDEKNPTVARMYLITYEQFIDVVKQENNGQEIFIDFDEVKRKESKILKKSWYGNIVYIGDDEEYPIYTLTHYKDFKYLTLNLPSAEYIKIIGAGLKESLGWSKAEIVNYLINKDGIKNNIARKDLIKIFES